MSKMSLRNRAK